MQKSISSVIAAADDRMQYSAGENDLMRSRMRGLEQHFELENFKNKKSHNRDIPNWKPPVGATNENNEKYMKRVADHIKIICPK
jgi:hypothetical protein